MKQIYNSQRKRESLNHSISVEEIEFVSINFSHKETQGPDCSLVNSTKYLRDNNVHLMQIVWKMDKESPDIKPGKNISRKENYRRLSFKTQM